MPERPHFPRHNDFSPEAERTLQILDYAILIISAADKEGILAKLKDKLSPGCIDFSQDINDPQTCEDIAVCDDRLLDTYLSDGTIDAFDVKTLISERKIFP
ncbi:MAG: translation elongation factor G, partial [Lachnospiraceae bacterium]|nr:translation elongation factor G [Lachnospiraceae bacterium]